MFEVQDQENPQMDTKRMRAGRGNECLVIFLRLHFPCCFIPDYTCTCLSDAPQGASGSDWQQGGKWMNELLIWRLWCWGDWRNPNMSGCNLPSRARPFSCSSCVFLYIVGFTTLQIYRFPPPPPAEGGNALFSLRGSSNGPLRVCVSERAISSQYVRNNIIIEPHFFPKHVQVSNGACKVKRWIVSISKAAGECLPSDLHSGWRHQRLHHWGDRAEKSLDIQNGLLACAAQMTANCFNSCWAVSVWGSRYDTPGCLQITFFKILQSLWGQNIIREWARTAESH